MPNFANICWQNLASTICKQELPQHLPNNLTITTQKLFRTHAPFPLKLKLLDHKETRSGGDSENSMTSFFTYKSSSWCRISDFDTIGMGGDNFEHFATPKCVRSGPGHECTYLT